MVALAAAAIEREALAAVAIDELAQALAISDIAVSQSMASKLPSARLRSGEVRRSLW